MWGVWMSICAALIGPSPGRIVVNIPAYRLDVYVGDSIERTIPVAVGMPRFPTPRGAFAITSIEWNPWWIPPKRRWAAKERPTPPGPNNPMGRVKLNFQPLYFLHGSPAAGSIGSAASHGCIRLKNDDAIALARLVHRFGSPGMAVGEIDQVSASPSTRAMALDVAVPLEIRYELVEIRGGHVYAYRDIYRLAHGTMHDEVLAALEARGVSRTLIDSARVAGFVRRIGAKGAIIDLDSLLLHR
jgi:murein L,D-transpeptidase YcbB/YkuD